MAYRYWAAGDCHWGLHDPRNGFRVRPTAQNRTEYQQASEKAFRFSSRLDRPLPRIVLMGHSLHKAVLPSDQDAQGSAQMSKWQHLHAERGPYARGSTASTQAGIALGAGYPVCAGIDPTEELPMTGGCWLPRMRGDRPHTIEEVWGHVLATPYARGSTDVDGYDRRVVRGYPVCAGIDQWQVAVFAQKVWLPRMRGDRPSQTLVHHGSSRATPYARGSTHARRLLPSSRRGYPVCAGIDPSGRRDSRTGFRLPRMRGDRPGVC